MLCGCVHPEIGCHPEPEGWGHWGPQSEHVSPLSLLSTLNVELGHRTKLFLFNFFEIVN